MSDIPNDNSKNHECANENPKDINFSGQFQEFEEIMKNIFPICFIHKKESYENFELEFRKSDVYN